ncbi:hypothetical protein PN36_33455 [Candidatus Thiomargarita nelsonii]|uniref:Uncharacterized protein n=1 Tax=Candidatus Thiomargarita nelsonii TaxID=1003181 RepID=A0A4E0QQ73_9GAMM|nr:hypothetical protein PN36_33455 [Candidatus Thiomargarita nelsonii]
MYFLFGFEKIHINLIDNEIINKIMTKKTHEKHAETDSTQYLLEAYNNLKFCPEAGDSLQFVDGKYQITLTPERTKILNLHAKELAKKAKARKKEELVEANDKKFEKD